MKGNVVLTSKEMLDDAVNILNKEGKVGAVDTWSKKEGANYVIWTFKNTDDAIRHARKFMELGFEYVQRDV